MTGAAEDLAAWLTREYIRDGGRCRCPRDAPPEMHNRGCAEWLVERQGVER